MRTPAFSIPRWVRSGLSVWVVLLTLSHFASLAMCAPLLNFVAGETILIVGNATLGWNFSVNSAIIVDGLGVWDDDSDGLDREHEIGLWKSTGELLVSTTVTNSSEPMPNVGGAGRWLFADIPFTELATGNYVVGAYYLDADTDRVVGLATAQTISQITFVDALQAGTVGLTMPEMFVIGGNDGVFGPNLRIVPEPGTSAVVLACSLLLGVRLRPHSRQRPPGC